MKKSILSLSLLSLSFNLFAAEADNFTARTLDLADAGEEVNVLANNYLKKAIVDLNKVGGCNEEALYKELRKYFANHSKGELVKDILYRNAVAINNLPIKQSVYENWEKADGFLLGRKKAATSPLALSPLIKIGDETVGVDKFEHMFGMGFTYFTKHYQKGKDIKDVLSYGIALEKTILGGNVFATGVFSYGDLSANFNGMRFWNHVLQKNDDILGSEHNLGPYVTCSASKWQVNEKNPIDFKNYIDASMDESINCSKFAGTKAVGKFKAAIKKRGFVDSNNQALCPVEPSKLQEMRQKYKPSGIEHLIINDEGLGKVSYFNEF
nr:TonB-dependent receptor [Bacteriovorax sp. HI3]